MAEGGVKGIVGQIRLIEAFVDLELLVFVLGCQMPGIIQREEDTTRELSCKLLARKPSTLGTHIHHRRRETLWGAHTHRRCCSLLWGLGRGRLSSGLRGSHCTDGRRTRYWPLIR